MPWDMGRKGWPLQIPSDNVTGTGTVNYIPVWTGAHTLGDSHLIDDGTDIFLQQPGGAPYRTFFMGVTSARSSSGGQPWLWIYSSAVGYAPNLAGNDIVIESSIEPAMTFLGTPTNSASIYFQDAINANNTRFGYNHNTDEYEFDIAGTTEVNISAGGIGVEGNNYVRWYDSTNTDYYSAYFNGSPYFGLSQCLQIDANDATYGHILITGGATDRCGIVISDSLVDSADKIGSIRFGHYDRDEESFVGLYGRSYNGGNDLYIGYGGANSNCSTGIRIGLGANATTLAGAELMLIWGARFDITAKVPFRVARLTTTERNALAAANGDIIFNTTDTKFQGYDGATWQNFH
jgi:hypothetical protein